MSLRAFHVVFISASTLLALFLAAWCLGMVPGGSGDTHLAAGAGALGAGMGLATYEAWFLRKTRGLR